MRHSQWPEFYTRPNVSPPCRAEETDASRAAHLDAREQELTAQVRNACFHAAEDVAIQLRTSVNTQVVIGRHWTDSASGFRGVVTGPAYSIHDTACCAHKH